MDHFQNHNVLDEEGKQLVVDIVKERWNFIHTSSMGFACLLSPNCYDMPWYASDKANTKKELMDYVQVFFNNDDVLVSKCIEELEHFLDMVPSATGYLKVELQSKPALSYWCQYGRSDYPNLAKIAYRLFTVPTSSAAAERIWSTFSFISIQKRKSFIN
jgi:uncharacterized membrane protein YukC